MASEIKLPQLGENLTGGGVLDVKVKAGDTVSQGQTLLEVEAEKATVEVPAPIAGRVTKMLVNKGDAIEVGERLCLMEGTDGAQQEGPVEAPAREAAGAKTEPKTPPTAKQKEQPKKTEKAEQQGAEASPPDGAAKKATAPVAEKPRKEEAAKPEAAERRPAAESTGDGRRGPRAKPAPMGETAVPAGPATRRPARELGVDLGQVHGSAPGGRGTQEDIKTHVRRNASPPC